MRSNLVLLAAIAAGLGVGGIHGDAEASRLRAVAEAEITPVVEAAPSVVDPWVYLGPQAASVSRLALSPLNPGRMMAVVDGSTDLPLAAVFYESASAGERWSFHGQLGSDVADVAFDAEFRDFVTGSFGLWFRGAGTPWWDLALHPEHGYALNTDRVDVHASAGAAVWVTASLGDSRHVFRISSDLQQWDDVTPAIPSSDVPLELAVSPSEPGSVAVAGLIGGSPADVFISHDHGGNWTTAATVPGYLITVSTLAWVGDRLYVGGLDSVTYRHTLYATADNGESWQLVLTSSDGALGRIDVAGDPTQPNRLWVGTREGVYRSTDGGQSWLPPAPASVQGVTQLVYEPVAGQLWAGLANEGVWVSDDHGQSWEARNERLGAMPVKTVASNPLDPSDVSTMIQGTFNYMAQMGHSTSGGLDWTREVTMSGSQGHAVRFAPSGWLYATLASPWLDSFVLRRATNGDWEEIGFQPPANSWVTPGDINFGASEDTLLVSARVFDYALGYYAHHLWRSGNGGQSWQPVLQGGSDTGFTRIERTQGPNGLRLFVLEQSYLSEAPSHLWASDDDGLTWFDLTAGLSPGTQQQYCAGDNGQLVYVRSDVASYEIEMYRSHDAGDSWTRTGWNPGTYFPGTPFTAMHCPGDAQQVFLGGGMGHLWLSHDGGESVQGLLATESTWGDTWLESIHLSPAGLYVGHRGGVWVNPDFALPVGGPQGLTVGWTLSHMRYRATLAWTGGTDQVEIRRDGVVVATVANTGSWSTSGLRTGPLPSWQVCDAGGSCSAVVAP